MVFVNVPCNATRWRPFEVSAGSPNGEMFNPVMLTKSPSAACKEGAGRHSCPTTIASKDKNVVTRARARKFHLISGEKLNPLMRLTNQEYLQILDFS